MPLAPAVDAPKLRIVDGRVFVEMKWEDADAVRSHFLRHGMPGTVKLDPAAREATLELWDDPDPVAARSVLGEWLR
jgi:hypothetical protein